MLKKILIACEFSGIVRDAFISRGHNAISCDILPTEREGPHYQGRLEDFIGIGWEWDLIVAFPPCTHLANSGARYFEQKRKDGRQDFAMAFFMMIAERTTPKIAIENPIGIMSTLWRKPDQIIQPYQFGHSTTKATCLWLKGLPLLQPTNIVDPGPRQYYASGKSSPLWHAKTGGGSGKKRSITFQGIADAMADQWGGLLNKELEENMLRTDEIIKELRSRK